MHFYVSHTVAVLHIFVNYYNGYDIIKIVKSATEFFIPRKTIREMLNNSKASCYAARSTKNRKGISKTSDSRTKQKCVRGLIVETRKMFQIKYKKKV